MIRAHRFAVVPAVLFAVGIIASCNKKEAPATPPVPVTWTPVVQQDVFVTQTWVGLLTGYKNADIRAQVTGYLMTQNYKEGSSVKTGDVLFTIDQRPFQAALAQAQADYAKAVSEAQLAQITLDRQTQLYKTKVISQQEYDTAYQNAQSAIASTAAQQAAVQTAQINLNYCTIRAPFDGIAGVAQAQIGDLVGPGGTATVLTQMSQVNPIKVNFSITEQEFLEAYSLIQELQNRTMVPGEGRIELKLANGEPYPEKGNFDFVNRQIDTSTGTIQITAVFPNESDILRPGLFGRVTAPVKSLKSALLVPQAATIELQGKYLVALLQPDNSVVSAPVKLGPVQGQNQVILEGVKLGDKVIVDGVEKLHPGVKVNATPYQAPPTPTPTPKPTPQASPAATATPGS